MKDGESKKELPYRCIRQCAVDSETLVCASCGLDYN